MAFPELTGRCAGVFFKASGKVVAAAKTGTLGNVADPHVGVGQKIGGLLKLIMSNDLGISLSCKPVDHFA